MSATHPLHSRQLEAVAPEETVWLSASAGTGKTQVLSSRVLRLLLQPGVEPGQLLCLTFTKAGAAEMAARIAEKLAGWVRLDDTGLARELQAIGADIGPDTLARARTLFAAVLDCPGGGLRIDTIHAFAQWLLGAFPQEAGLTPGTRPMEDREKALLARQVLADLLLEAEVTRPDLIAAAEELSLRLGAGGVESYLLRCAEARDVWFSPGWRDPLPLRPAVLRLLDLPADADARWLEALYSDAVFDADSLELCLSAYRQWNTATGQEASAVIGAWLAAEPAERLGRFGELFKVLFTQKDTVKNVRSCARYEECFEQAAETVLAAMIAVRERQALLGLAERMVPALTLGRAFALAWDAAKTREGLVDFDDQIRRAASLLQDADYAQWIGYKLDRQFDHILVDEAQDTNAAQWEIIDALTAEFFSGRGQRDEKLRTLFVVGDYKQAIFRFQGTSPENFRIARDRVRDKMRGAADNAAALRSGERVRDLRELGLGQSFRTAQPILDFVDRAIAAIGHEAFGLDRPAERHSGLDLPGQVTLWKPVGLRREEDSESEAPEDDGDETWLLKPERDMAEGIARQVRDWLDHGFPLAKGVKPGDPPRAAGPGDVMVLVRKRGDLAALIVARLHAHGVPVAGVDRLRLGAPLAVRDLVAALRFAAQPFDDLNLACLLGSPLIGWSQEQLLKHCYRDKDVPLWTHLRRGRHPEVAAALAQLGELLALADYEPPQGLLHWLLVGPWDGRRKLVARLGREANDPIDELLNAAHAYAATATPSLAGFLQWFDVGDGELKREADNAAGLVRVMTVHGAKGLQAPIVILADATGDPDRNRGSAPALPERGDSGWKVPLPGLGKEEAVGVVGEHLEREKAAEEQEHWRLLYVAMTRAEEALFVGGALLPRDKGEVPEKSWYASLQGLFGLSPDWRDDPLWGRRLVHGSPTTGSPQQARDDPGESPEALPAWVSEPPPPEARPPRPLAPSSLGEDLAADPPHAAGMERAAARGVLMHRLLERLPELAAPDRQHAAEAWLTRHGSEFSAGERAEMIARAQAVLADPAWAELFSPSALAEVPIAATVGGQVVAGTIDRLLVQPERVLLVDFKTTRRPPGGIGEVSVAILRQMAAYVASLEAVYPGRTIEAALLYTETPLLIAIPVDLIERHKQPLLAMQ